MPREREGSGGRWRSQGTNEDEGAEITKMEKKKQEEKVDRRDGEEEEESGRNTEKQDRRDRCVETIMRVCRWGRRGGGRNKREH